MLNFMEWLAKEATAIINYKNLDKMGIATHLSDPASKRGLYLNFDIINPEIYKKMAANRNSDTKQSFSDDEIENIKKANMNSKIFGHGFIEGGYYTDKEETKKNPPRFDHSNEITSGAESQTGRNFKINLFDRSKNKGLWQLVTGKMPKNYFQIVSLQGGKSHLYACSVKLEAPFTLAYFPSMSEPRNRVSVNGQINFGKEVGEIKTSSGKIHKLYRDITIR